MSTQQIDLVKKNKTTKRSNHSQFSVVKLRYYGTQRNIFFWTVSDTKIVELNEKN